MFVTTFNNHKLQVQITFDTKLKKILLDGENAGNFTLWYKKK